MVSQRFDYSGIFTVKEEFIFVFGGNGANGLLNSVEVFDTHREIWRIFDSSSTTNEGFCIKRSGFEAISFCSGNKDILHLIGGLDENKKPASLVDEFFIRDMRTLSADWSLPQPLCNFGFAQDKNKQEVLAGGSETGSVTNKVFKMAFKPGHGVVFK